MVQPTQCNGSGWTAGRPIDSLGRTPTTSQKQLRGEMVNPVNNDKATHDDWGYPLMGHM